MCRTLGISGRPSRGLGPSGNGVGPSGRGLGPSGPLDSEVGSGVTHVFLVAACPWSTLGRGALV